MKGWKLKHIIILLLGAALLIGSILLAGHFVGVELENSDEYHQAYGR